VNAGSVDNEAVGGFVEVGVLGPVELRRDGDPVPLAGAPQRVVLARLALAQGRVVPVADLVDALWVDEPPDNAVGNLHSYVSRLRRGTGPDAVRREPAGYRLDLPAEAVDVARMERLVAAARTQGPAAAAETLTEALGIWRGPPLSDVADRLAFVPDVARLTEWHHQVREQCLDHWLAAGQADRVLPELEELTATEPLRETPHLLPMRALHLTGRTVQALTVGRAYRERIVDGHGVDPGPALDELQRRLLSDDPELRPAPQPAPADAPGSRTPVDVFVGRGPELAALGRAARTDRVVTVVGPGGVGKTRLVWELLDREAGSVPRFVVELAELSVPADVAVAVAGAFGLRSAPRGGVAAIAERLGAEPALLVLDNCEHLLAAVSELVAAVVARCPGVRVVCTSRQRLAVAGERVLRLGPLPEADQVALFCDRAALLRANFDDSPRTRELAGDVCRLLDGLPLAVELAARREAVFGLVQLRDRLSAGLAVLDPVRGGDRSTAVSATVEWSYRLLDPAAQALLDRLAVCRGGFGLDGLAHLAEDGDGTALLAELVDASLVVSDLAADPPRYRLLETVRHSGLAHLGAEREEQARAAHARWMLAHAEELVHRLRSRDPWTTPALRRELANLQEALAWLTGSGRWDDAARLGALLAVKIGDDPNPAVIEQLARLAPETVVTETDALRAFAAGGAEWLAGGMAASDRLLTAAVDTLPADHPLRWSILLFRMSNSMFTGDVAAVQADSRLLAADRAAPPWAAAMGACCAALMNSYSGDAEGAGRWLDEHADVLAAADTVDGFVAFTRGELASPTDPAAALRWFDRSRQLSARSTQTYVGHLAAVGRTAVLIRLGRQADAIAACAEQIVSLRRVGMTAQVWTMLRLTAELLGSTSCRTSTPSRCPWWTPPRTWWPPPRRSPAGSSRWRCSNTPSAPTAASNTATCPPACITASSGSSAPRTSTNSPPPGSRPCRACSAS
jgi:predicted ATPase/DNA-binding SARP family transcriptional activator